MNINNARFVLSAVKKADFPPDDKPHIVFSGKSNVGKSSVINRLLHRKNLARVGQTPGKTQHINFFDIDGVAYYVDLPGYGYANRSKSELDRWAALINTYLQYASSKSLCIQIIDIRHEPSANDRMMIDWLEKSNFKYVIIANKADKLSKAQADKSIKEIRNSLGECKAEIIAFSAVKGQGEDCVAELINQFIVERTTI